MRNFLIAGNWKMNPPDDPVPLLQEMRSELSVLDKIELLIAPPFTVIPQAVEIFEGTDITVAGQNLFWEDKGAFTGEVSAPMLKALGATGVIIGHSERRQFFNETDYTVNLRLKSALKWSLKPILCLGETERERLEGETFNILRRQLEGALQGLSEKELQGFVIAYEPVWAIGTGRVAEPSDAQEAHKFLRQLVSKHYSEKLADETRILYGGSVKPDNASGLFHQPDVDGALVGGASLSAASFANIARTAMELIK
jgi:triosephosphate isomerase